jgi:hypothetical protein
MSADVRTTLVVAFFAIAGCAPIAPCDASTCQGCCTSTGLCVEGSSLTTCGSGGEVCGVCGVQGRCVQRACATSTVDAGPVDPGHDGGSPDGGALDGGRDDAGAHDAGAPDAGRADAGLDAGVADAGLPDAGGCTPRSDVVIAQLYPTGGDSAAASASKDWVELHNRTASVIDLGGWAIQYASATGSSWRVNALPTGTTLGAGATLVVGLGGGALGGGGLPTPNVALATASNLAGGHGKLALTRTSTALTGNCPTGAAISDFVGYGTVSGTNVVDCFEGASPAPTPSATGSVRRSAGGCTDTNVNGLDFAAVTPPAPAGATLMQCSCP